MKKIFLSVLLLICLLTSVCLTASAAPRYPETTGHLTDAAAVLQSEQLFEDLGTLQKRLDRADTLDLYIVTVDFLDGSSLADYGKGLFEHMDLGKDDLLLVMAVGEDKFGFVAGSQVERKITPAIQARLLSNAFETEFKAWRYEAAVSRLMPALVMEINRAYDERVSTDGLFNTGRDNIFAWMAKLVSDTTIVPKAPKPTTGLVDDLFGTGRVVKNTMGNLLKVLVVVVVLIFVFGHGRFSLSNLRSKFGQNQNQ